MCFGKFSLRFGVIYIYNDTYTYMYICQLPPFFPESESSLDYVLQVRRWLLRTELQVLHRCEILEQSSFESECDPSTAPGVQDETFKNESLETDIMYSYNHIYRPFRQPPFSSSMFLFLGGRVYFLNRGSRYPGNLENWSKESHRENPSRGGN